MVNHSSAFPSGETVLETASGEIVSISSTKASSRAFDLHSANGAVVGPDTPSKDGAKEGVGSDVSTGRIVGSLVVEPLGISVSGSLVGTTSAGLVVGSDGRVGTVGLVVASDGRVGTVGLVVASDGGVGTLGLVGSEVVGVLGSGNAGDGVTSMLGPEGVGMFVSVGGVGTVGRLGSEGDGGKGMLIETPPPIPPPMLMLSNMREHIRSERKSPVSQSEELPRRFLALLVDFFNWRRRGETLVLN